MIEYTNFLTMLAFWQAVEMENMRRLLDRNAETLNVCKKVIESFLQQS